MSPDDTPTPVEIPSVFWRNPLADVQRQADGIMTDTVGPRPPATETLAALRWLEADSVQWAAELDALGGCGKVAAELRQRADYLRSVWEHVQAERFAAATAHELGGEG